MSILIPLLSASFYAASATGGDHDGGQVYAVEDHQAVVLHMFCAPRAYACQSQGATPIADLVAMPDGALIGATQVGGDHYQYWPGSGLVYRLARLSNGEWHYGAVYYLNDCLPYGPVRSIWPVDGDTIGGYCSQNGHGVAWTLQLDPPIWSAIDWW